MFSFLFSSMCHHHYLWPTDWRGTALSQCWQWEGTRRFTCGLLSPPESHPPHHHINTKPEENKWEMCTLLSPAHLCHKNSSLTSTVGVLQEQATVLKTKAKASKAQTQPVPDFIAEPATFPVNLVLYMEEVFLFGVVTLCIVCFPDFNYNAAYLTVFICKIQRRRD